MSRSRPYAPVRRLVVAATLALAACWPAAQAADPAEREGLEPLRVRLRNQLGQQQLRLQQQLGCLEKAGSIADLQRCRMGGMPQMHPGMGGWGCPIW